MGWFGAFLAGIRAIGNRGRVNGELDEELRGFMADSEAEKVRRGMSAEAARRAARVEMGSTAVVRHRVWASRWESAVDGFGQDLRLALRVLAKSPGFLAVAVISLGLGIGANTAIFSVAKRVLFDALPVARPAELRMLTWRSGHERLVPPVWGDISSTPDGGLESNTFSYPVIEALRRQKDVFADLVAFKDVPVTATVGNLPEVVDAQMVTGNTFAAMGVGTLIGRPLSEADELGNGSGRVAVVSEGFWTLRMGGSATAIGSVIHLNGVPVTVVGVAPARFTGLTMGRRVAVFVPLAMQPELAPRAQGNSVSLLDNPESWWLTALIRLRPDVGEAKAQAALDVALRQAAAPVLRGKDAGAFRLVLAPGARGVDELHGQFAEASYVLMGLAGLVLLLACVNLANLLLARAAARQREMATRMALGTGRGRIARQMLTESLLLAGLGGAAGLLLGFLGRNGIPRMLADPGLDTATRIMQVDFDWGVVGFTAAVALGTGILFGLAPAWRAIGDAKGSLREGSHSVAGQRGKGLGNGLVVVQVALSTLLLIGAGLFVRTLHNLGNTALGFQSDHMLLFRLNPPRSVYDDARAMRFYAGLEERLAALPGVRSVTMSTIAIMGDGHSGTSFHVTGTPVDREQVRVQINGVGQDFFQTMGIPILQGRGFTAQDTANSPKVAVINQALAKRFFPKGDAIGRRFEADAEDVDVPATIVGIAADTRYADLRSDTPPTFYISHKQQLAAGRRVVEIRTAADPGSVLNEVRAAVAAEDRDLPLIDVRTMEQQVASTIGQERIFARLTSGFGLLALGLAAIGVYGVLSYNVSRRTSEIGIRLALGAQAGAVRWMVLRESLLLLGIGLAVGLPVTLGLTRVIQAQLFGLSGTDPLTIAGAVLVVGAMTLVAAWLPARLPARRASRVDPMVALRCE